GADGGQYRVLRGGSWYGFFTNERSAFRAWMFPDNRDAVTGFRCVVSSARSP
ncbi:MAG: SUMF1/EgtB/PvdO family nonheme iron enzyme, partial [Acidobacteriaceae bacterium]